MAWQIWIVIAILLIIAELFSLTFYLFLFAAGAFGAALIQAMGLPLAYQVVTFAVISIVLVVFVQPFLKRTIKHQGRLSNAEALVGQIGNVTEEITGESGLVKVSGEIWTARSLDNRVFLVGTNVMVAKVEGAKLLVKPVD